MPNWGGYLGQVSNKVKGLGGGLKKVVSPVNQLMDPADVFGGQKAERQKDLNADIAGQDADINNLWASRPEFQSARAPSGALGSQFAIPLGQGINKRADIGGIKEREAIGGLGYRGDVSGIGVAGDVGVGRAGDMAQEDLEALHKRAFGTETSPYAQKLYDIQKLEEAGATDTMARQSAGAQQGAFNELMQSGGMDSGSRENMARQFGRDKLLASQGVAAAGAKARLGIGAEDESQRLALQTSLPGMALQQEQYVGGLGERNRAYKTGTEQFNVGLAERNRGYQTDRDLANIGLAERNRTYGTGVDQYNKGLETGNRDYDTQVNMYNQNRADTINTTNSGRALQDLYGENEYGANMWGTQGNIIGSKWSANALAKQGAGGGLAGGLGGLFGK